MLGCVLVGSRTRRVRRSEESQSVRFNARVCGNEGVNEVGEGGFNVHSSLPPFAPSPSPPAILELPVAADKLVLVLEFADPGRG